MGDSLGDRIKSQYEDRTRYYLPRRTYTILRVDGKAFHTFTRGCTKPFDAKLTNAMDTVATNLCEFIQGAQRAYVQSDEISVLITDMATKTTNAWFDGNVQKIASISASFATAEFNKVYPCKVPAMFDARVFTIPDPIEVNNYFIWRQKDWYRNSINMAARSAFSHKELHGKSCDEMFKMLQEKGIDWNAYDARYKNGGTVLKENGKFICLANHKFSGKDTEWVPKLGY